MKVTNQLVEFAASSTRRVPVFSEFHVLDLEERLKFLANLYTFLFLPTAYGVWWKVMFSQARVILLTGGVHPGYTPWVHPMDAPFQWMHPVDAQWMHPPLQKTDGQRTVGTHLTGMHTY